MGCDRSSNAARRPPRQETALVDDLVVGGFFHPVVDRFEMGNLESPHRLDRQLQRLIGRTGRVLLTKPGTRLPELAKHLRPVEPLAFTMLAETHPDNPFRRRPIATRAGTQDDRYGRRAPPDVTVDPPRFPPCERTPTWTRVSFIKDTRLRPSPLNSGIPRGLRRLTTGTVRALSIGDCLR